jgi:hypothetical protein
MKAIKLLVMGTLLALLVAGLAWADGDLTRPRQVLGNGASAASGGEIHVVATLGQPLVGPVSGASDVTLGQGFWYGGAVQHPLYLPLLQR